MSAPVARWEPGRDPLHRFVQLLDVLAIALNRFRQLSFKLPKRGMPDYDHDAWAAQAEHLRSDLSEVTEAVCPRADFAPQNTAARLADDAVAALVRAGFPEGEQTVRDAAALFNRLGWCVPHYAPYTPECPTWKAFDAEGALLQEYTAVRFSLLSVIARTGQSVPAAIRRRHSESHISLTNSGEQPVSNAELLRRVRETDVADELTPDVPNPISENAERVLRQWKTVQRDLVHRAEEGRVAWEQAQDALEAWARVAYFAERDDGSSESVSLVRAHYVERLMELGAALRAAGLAERVRQVVPGDGEARQLAVELLRCVVGDNRPGVEQLDTAMWDHFMVGGADAIHTLRHDLRCEVLGIRPPVRVPPHWEGHPPDNAVDTAGAFLAWVEERLRVLDFTRHMHGKDDYGADTRNAHRLLDALGVRHTHPFPSGPVSGIEFEAQMRELRKLLDVSGVAIAPPQTPPANHADERGQPVALPPADLRPDEFRLPCGAVVHSLSANHITLLRAVSAAGVAGLPISVLGHEFNYADDEKGRKALAQLVKRTQDKLDDKPVPYLIEIRNGRYCLTPTVPR